MPDVTAGMRRGLERSEAGKENVFPGVPRALVIVSVLVVACVGERVHVNLAGFVDDVVTGPEHGLEAD